MMNRQFKLFTAIVIVLSLTIITACGGGGGSVAGGGIGGTGMIASGSVTEKGSITVNGVKYNVEGASFEREDEAPIILPDESETETRVGMVLEVEGELGTPNKAFTIRYEDIVEGHIDSLVSATTEVKVLSILGQQVIVENGLTQFDGSLAFASIELEGGFIEVSGFRRADGKIQATYLEDRTSATPAGRLEVRGPVTVVDADTFMIGSLMVNYSGTPVLTDNTVVEVKGASYTSPTLTASSVEIDTTPGLSSENFDNAEVEGFVQGSEPINPGDTFFVDGQDVLYDAFTVFEGGTAADLVNGTKVEAEGALSGGVLTADKITFRENIRIEGNAVSVAGTGLNGQLQIQGLNHPTYPDIVIVFSEGVTEFNGINDLIDLQSTSNNNIRVRARYSSIGNNLVATRIDSRGAEDSILILRAPATSADYANETSIVLLGDITDPSDPLTTIINTPLSGMAYSDETDNIFANGRAGFYSALTIGQEIKAKGSINTVVTNPVPTWTELQLE
ncbi:MAG: hypothetical protein C0623_04115 [Desulfuromonas sp.]|nr:MAG: hypothetical protein C0623_04115 [Desulfuromonas sp.]